MSKMRPELTGTGNRPAPTNGTAYYVIYNAVQAQPGLIHGKLHEGREHCAIGSYFAQPNSAPLYETMIDEVATVNDSVPYATKAERRAVVLRWLKWKLQQCNFPLGRGRKLKSPR